MNLALTISLFVLMIFQTAWAKPPVAVRIDSIAIGAISSDELQKISLGGRNFNTLFNLSSSSSTDPVYQQDIGKTEDYFKKGLDYFSSPAFQRQPVDLGPAIKEYLSHAQQDTQQIISKMDDFKSHPADLYGKYDFSGFTSLRPWSIYPQEMPTPDHFTPQEQVWQQKNIPFGHLGISQENDQWGYGLATYYKNNWQWTPSYKIGESLGLNGPIIAFGKTPHGPEISIYDAEGDFIGDVNKTKLDKDPSVTARYLLRAAFPAVFGPYSFYDRTIPVSDIIPQGVVILPSGYVMSDDMEFAERINHRLEYNEDFWDEDWDCDGDEYYYDHEEECDDFYDYADPPYTLEEVFSRNVLDKNPNDTLFPNLKPKKKSGGGFFAGLVSAIAPTGPITVGDGSSSEGVTVIDQYSLPQIGFTDTSDPNSAWNTVDTKGPNVTVAVIDSGLDMTHPDGPQFIWQNPVDGSHGWNFLDENTDVKDQRDHGTLVAGIIAAKTNNGTGMAGINAGAVIMPLKVADKKGNANSLNIYRAIHYAVDHGARVINISLGGLGISRLENLAINYARSHNVLVVIASGNSENDIETFGPSSSGGAIAVGALNFDGSLATVSNWGANNSLMAPGEQIFSLHSKDARWDGPAGQRDRLYTKESGTSFSAPMVAATASLLLVKNPKLTADQLEDILLSSAKPLGPDRWNGKTGAGLLDAAKALRTDPQDTFNVKITRIKTAYKYKKVDYVDVYATIRGAVDYFTVEVGRGKYTHSFRPVIGISGQQANDDLVAHIPNSQLRGSNDWILLVRAMDKSGKEYQAKTALTIK